MTDGRQRPAVVLLHHAGGSAALFAPLRRRLRAVTAIPVELPGRGRRWREPLVSSVDDAVTALRREVEARVTGPWVVLGHSLGAHLAVALTAEIATCGGRLPRCAVVSANDAPGVAAAPPDPDTLDDEAVLRVAGAVGGLPSEVQQEATLRARAAAVLRADMAVARSFLRRHRTTRVAVPVSVWRAEDDPVVAASGAAWAAVTTGRCDERRFTGGHFYLANDPDPVVAALTATLDV